MPSSLHEQNRLALLALTTANLVFFYSVVQADAITSANWTALARNLEEVIPAGLGLIFIGLLNAQLSPDAKARIVFLRWHDPLPGARAFTEHAVTDPRIDIAALQRAHGPLPKTPREQNALWYKFYKSVEEEPSVSHSHRQFLLTRDYTSLSFMMACVLGSAAFAQLTSARVAAMYLALLVLQFLITRRAAKNYGTQFVKNVLALKSTGR